MLDNPTININTLQIIHIGLDIAKGVHHLHADHIYHRDLSARNILVTEGKNNRWICKVLQNHEVSMTIDRLLILD